MAKFLKLIRSLEGILQEKGLSVADYALMGARYYEKKSEFEIAAKIYEAVARCKHLNKKVNYKAADCWWKAGHPQKTLDLMQDLYEQEKNFKLKKKYSNLIALAYQSLGKHEMFLKYMGK